MAEYVVRRQAEDAGLGDAVQLDSAGIGGWHSGERADRGAIRALQRRGYECRGHVARRFQSSWFAERDLIVALDRGHERDLRALAPDEAAAGRIRLLRSFSGASGGDLDVPDPYYGDAADFDYCLDLIEAACPGILAHVRERAATRR